MGWEVVKPRPANKSAPNNIMVSYRRMTPEYFKVIISIPMALAAELGWKPKDKILVARGTGAEAGVARLAQTNANGYSLQKVNKISTKYSIGLQSWVPLPKKAIRAAAVKHAITKDKHPTLAIELPDWLINEVGDMGPRRNLFGGGNIKEDSI